MADEYASHEQLSSQMDISRELENQAAVEAVAAAVAAQDRHREEQAISHSHSPTPSHSHSHPHSHSHSQQPTHDLSQSELPQPGQGPPPPPAYQRIRPASGTSASPLPFPFGPPHRQAPDSPLTNAQQLMVLREFYAKNPNPSKRELEMLAERTGRPWNKIREYFRQRRNKLRGLSDLEGMEEPGRASSWLQVTYRPGPSTAAVSQLSLYHAYKTRFDPYSTTAPLLGGQELIQLACSTFPGCEMARDDGDYVLRGLRDKDGAEVEAEWDRGVDAMVEPLRGATWLLSTFQHQADPSTPPSLSQTELYTAYAARFSSLLPSEGEDMGNLPSLDESIDHAQAAAQAAQDDDELKDFEANMAADDINAFLPGGEHEHEHGQHGEQSEQGGGAGVNGGDQQSQEPDQANGQRDDPEEPRPPPRLLNPVELIALARMTFPKCEPAVDEEGRFVIRGIERREGVEKGRGMKMTDMFPFALATAPTPSSPAHPFNSLLKRKLALLNAEADEHSKRRLALSHSNPSLSNASLSNPTLTLQPGLNSSLSSPGLSGIGVNIGATTVMEPEEELGDEDRELVDGLKRFRHSRLGREVRDVCVQQ